MSGRPLLNLERPGRAIDRAVLFLALLALGCATRVGEAPADLSQPPPDQGVVVGRFEEIDSEGEPPGMYRFIGPVLAVQIDESFGDPFEIALAGPVADFSAVLPAGNYRWRSPCSDSRVTFAVFPGRVTYVGTLRIRRGTLLDCRVTFHDDYEAVVARFRAAHPAFGAEVEKHLMIRWSCDGYARDCRPVFLPDAR